MSGIRWNRRTNSNCVDPRIDRFLEDIHAVCFKHGLSISHEDEHGSFIIVKRERVYIDWLNAAHADIDPEESK